MSLAGQRARLRLRGYRFQERHCTPDDRGRLDQLWHAAAGLMIGDDARAAELQARYLAAALRVGEPVHVARGLAMEAAFLAGSSRASRARATEVQARAEELAGRTGDAVAGALAAASAGIAAAGAGAWRAARERWMAALPDLERDEHARPAAALVRSWLVAPLWYLGDLGRLFDHVAGMSMTGGNDPLLAAAARTGLANAAHLCRGDVDGARRERERAAAEPARPHAVHSDLLARAHIDLYGGEPGAAWQQVSDGWRALGRSRALRIQRLRVEAHHLRARCALAAAAAGRDRDARLEDAERDTGEIERERMPWSTALARLLRAATCHLRGESEGARAWVRAAEADLERAQMSLYLHAARRAGGMLAGNGHGAERAQRADQWLHRAGVADPARLSAVLAPGLPF